MSAAQFKLELARLAAVKVVTALLPWCARIEIAGSIRRGRPFVGDIDIVLQPVDATARAAIEGRCRETTKRIKGGEQYVVYEMANGIQLDLWFAHGAIPSAQDMFGGETAPARPPNFGMLLLARTGSAAHNVHLAQIAQARGLHFDPHAGLKRGGNVIASEEEADIFKALSVGYVEPERRER